MKITRNVPEDPTVEIRLNWTNNFSVAVRVEDWEVFMVANSAGLERLLTIY